MKAGLARARLASLMRPARAPALEDPWSEYLRAVEPALAGVARVHRFARPPVIAHQVRQPPVSVWIDGTGERAQRTRALLNVGTTIPAEIIDGPLAPALAQIRTEHVILVGAGDEPAPLALERLAQAAVLAPDAHVITCDDDALTPGGRRRAPRFRPGPSPDRWLASDESGPMMLVRTSAAAKAAGGLRGGPAWRHELALQLAGRASERHGHVPLLLCHRPADAVDPPPLAPEAVDRLLRQWEPGARLEQDGRARVVRRPVSGEPSIEVIVCFRDRPELLARCVSSLLAQTDYDRLRLALVDNGSASLDTAELLAQLSRDRRIRVLRDARAFNFASLNNGAVASSEADVIVFLNNDTEVVQHDWVAILLEEAVRPEVGAVAPMLLYPDGKVQHAGAALGLHGYAGHPFAGLHPDTETPFGHASGGTRNWLAVTAACMMIERSKFLNIGGFDESFVVAGNDVDLCLRLTAAGHRSLCVPRAVLVHDESRSRGAHIDPADFVASERSYGEFRTIGDPFYNPNLTLHATDCSVRAPERGTP
jgi:GT2 family glycosyltransferase